MKNIIYDEDKVKNIDLNGRIFHNISIGFDQSKNGDDATLAVGVLGENDSVIITKIFHGEEAKDMYEKLTGKEIKGGD